MINWKALSGKWNKAEGKLIGIIDASLSARTITGSELDQDYEVHAVVNIISGKVSVIVNFDYDIDWLEYYMEMILDPTLNKVTLDAVIRNANGTENTRVTLASRDMPIETGMDYNLKVVSKELVDDVFGVYGYVNGFLVVEAEDLDEGFNVGMAGFECLGVENDYSQFNKIFLQKRHYYTTIDTLLNEIRSIAKTELVGNDGTDEDLYNKLENHIIECSRFIDGETQRSENFFQCGGVELIEYHNGIGVSPPVGMYNFSESGEAWEAQAATIFTSQRPILDITSIHRNTASIGETDNWLAITAFRWFKHGEINFSSSAIPPQGNKNIRIIYKVGYTKTPLDIQMACTRLIVNLINKQIADRTATFQTFDRPTAINFAMPNVYTSDIKAVLARYKLTSFGEM